MLILARHGETPSIALQQSQSPDSRIQGVGRTMPLSERGAVQSFALGYGLGEFVAARNLEVVAVQTPDVLRAVDARDKLLEAADLYPPPILLPPDERLRNMDKGDLEGRLRSEAYPTDEIRERQASDWHFRHGSAESGGETAYESGRRWLGWFEDVARPFEESDEEGNKALLVVGCNFVTAFGTWMLTHPDRSTPDNLPPLRHVTQNYRLENGTATIVENKGEGWEVIGRIIPGEEQFAQVTTVPAEYQVTPVPAAQ